MASGKRLIDVSAWKSFYDDKKNILDRFYTHDAGYEDAIDNVDDWMDAQPVVDAVEVVHGHWVSLTDCSNAGVYCSVCNKKVYKEDYAWCNRKKQIALKLLPQLRCKDGRRKERQWITQEKN